jgi:cytochrome b6-f complex iron-sulfur subunit
MLKRILGGRNRSDFQASPKAGQMSRRKFFSRIGLTTFFLAMGGVFASITAFILPKLNFEPRNSFSIGRPEEYKEGDMRLLESQQVYVFRSAAGFQVVSAICTHLGCSYKPFQGATSEFNQVHAQCPCHGTVFARDGRVIGGPAPRPLPFFDIALSPDGRLIVDKGINILTDDLSKASGQGVGHDLYFDSNTGEMIAGQLPDGEDCIPCQG